MTFLSSLLAISLLATPHSWAIDCKEVLKGARAGEIMKSFEDSADKECSSWMDKSSGIFTPKHITWKQCCINHDIPYWMGGSQKQRLEADEELAQCVASAGSPTMAQLMFLGVRKGGGPNGLGGTGIASNNSYHWGYGWTRNTKRYDHDEFQTCFMKSPQFKAMLEKAKGWKKTVPAYQPEKGTSEARRMRNETIFFQMKMKLHRHLHGHL